MLVLGRRSNQAIKIGDDIFVHVVSIDQRGQVKIGIVAPKHMNIARTELLGTNNGAVKRCIAPECKQLAAKGNYCAKHHERYFGRY